MKHIKTFESYSVNEGNGITPEEIANEWSEKEGNNFFHEFLESYPTKEDYEQRLEDYRDRKAELSTEYDKLAEAVDAEILMLETEFRSFPINTDAGFDIWNEFISNLYNSSWGEDHEDRLPDWMK